MRRVFVGEEFHPTLPAVAVKLFPTFSYSSSLDFLTSGAKHMRTFMARARWLWRILFNSFV